MCPIKHCWKLKNKKYQLNKRAGIPETEKYFVEFPGLNLPVVQMVPLLTINLAGEMVVQLCNLQGCQASTTNNHQQNIQQQWIINKQPIKDFLANG